MIIWVIFPIIISIFSLYYLINPHLYKWRNINSINHIYKIYENIALEYEWVNKEIILDHFWTPRIINPIINSSFPWDEEMETNFEKYIWNCYNIDDSELCFIFNKNDFSWMFLSWRWIKIPWLYVNYNREQNFILWDFSINDLLVNWIVNKEDIKYIEWNWVWIFQIKFYWWRFTWYRSYYIELYSELLLEDYNINNLYNYKAIYEKIYKIEIY